MKHLRIALLFALLATPALADSYHHHTINTSAVKQESSSAMGLAAAQNSFDWGTHSFQGSIGAGSHNGSQALSFGLGKRFGRALINGSIAVDDDSAGFGAGISWKLK